jgi:hypothetical protein
MKKYVKPIVRDYGDFVPNAQGDTCATGHYASGPGTKCAPFGSVASGSTCNPDGGAAAACLLTGTVPHSGSCLEGIGYQA